VAARRQVMADFRAALTDFRAGLLGASGEVLYNPAFARALADRFPADFSRDATEVSTRQLYRVVQAQLALGPRH
jgi:hypothetical protein